jgi:hypothetical protein
MTEQNPVTGQPYGGRDERDDEDGLPGERPSDETVSAPSSASSGDESASRAASDGPMTSDPPGELRGSEGIPQQVDAPSPADATDADPPGGSAANQTGRTPDR